MSIYERTNFSLNLSCVHLMFYVYLMFYEKKNETVKFLSCILHTAILVRTLN